MMSILVQQYRLYLLFCNLGLLFYFIRVADSKEVGGVGIKFIVEPKDTIVPTGGSGVLNCAARGEGQPKISWKKDGSLISFVGDTRRSILANGSLHITSLYRTRESRPDEGMYQCFVTLDGVGSILSRSAKLQAASLARFDEEPEDISVGIGQTARFSCAAQGIPPPTVTWFKDEFPLVLDDSRMTVLPSGSLEISQILNSDEGVYNCNISNVDKHFVSRSGRLALNKEPDRDTPPVFTAVPKNQVVISGNSVVLECSTVAYPQPTITWLKDGVTIDLRTLGSRYSLIGEGNLMIANAEESDKGTYQCRAENREDSSDVSATLEVHVQPRVLSTPGNFYAYEKEDVELPCKIYGKPMPTIQWFKNGDMIIEGDYFQIVNGNNLKILGCLSSDTAMYQCFGTNPSGNVQASVHLRVLKKGEPIPEAELLSEPLHLGEVLPQSGSTSERNASYGPSSPRELVAVLISTRFVTLSWKPPAAPNGNITAYAIYYKELGSDRERVLNTTHLHSEEVNVQGLLPNKRYTFRVVPYNERVAGQTSREITVLTQPEVDVPGQPRFLKAWPVSPTRIDLHWAPPEVTNGIIQRYKVYYAESSENGFDGPEIQRFSHEEHDVDEIDEDDEDYLIPKDGAVLTVTVTSPEAVLEDLRVFTEYFIWVVALNENGPGANSDQVRATTLSDAPADTPHNVSVEPASSTSIAIRWEPPPMEFRNGIITGYKLKYKPKGRKRAETMTTDGNSRLMALNELERGVEYQIKIAALNVNGTGPFTEWVSATTFQRDLDETQFPDKPNSLQARAMTDSITITWTPPVNTNVMVRGYTIGWGKGIPDVYSKIVDGKRRSFTIDKLKPNSEYVISLRASNQVGDGVPIYENVRTRETSSEDDDEQKHHHRVPQLPPPVGLRASVISSTSVVISWTDSSLSKSQVVTDKRHYMVRYAPTDALGLSRPKATFKYLNSTGLNTILNDLKPNTMYEFSVKLVKNRHSSEWSLVALNKTFAVAVTTTHANPTEVSPHAAPQDLTLLAMTGEDETSVVILNWQPPKVFQEDNVKGYLIYYTTNPQLKEWVEEVVSDDVLTHQVTNLTPDTKYYFRMSARINSKGVLSPNTETKSVTTPQSRKMQDFSANGKNNHRDGDSKKSSQMILYILITLSVVFALASVSLCVYYRNRGLENSPKHNSLKKIRKPELKPPDLWIHHDQMELKGLEKGGHGHQRLTPMSPSTRGSIDFEDPEEKVPLQHTTNSLDKTNYLGSYAGNTDKNGPITQFHSHSLGRRKPKPIKIPAEPFFYKKDGSGGGSGTLDGRNPVYMRSQSQSRGHLPGDNLNLGPNLDPHKPYENVQSGSSTASSQQNLNTTGQYSAPSDYGAHSGTSLGTLGRRAGSNLRSFTVPIPPSGPPMNQPNTPQNSKVCIRPVGVGMAPSGGGSPVKRISASQLPISSGYPQSLSPNIGFPGEESPLQKCYSTEELSQEISNLEGLMKDLNAITASEFQC